MGQFPNSSWQSGFLYAIHFTFRYDCGSSQAATQSDLGRLTASVTHAT